MARTPPRSTCGCLCITGGIRSGFNAHANYKYGSLLSLLVCWDDSDFQKLSFFLERTALGFFICFISCLLFCHLLLFKFYLFIHERQTERGGSGTWDSIPGPQDHDPSRRQIPNRLSHPAPLCPLFLSIIICAYSLTGQFSETYVLKESSPSPSSSLDLLFIWHQDLHRCVS